MRMKCYKFYDDYRANHMNMSIIFVLMLFFLLAQVLILQFVPLLYFQDSEHSGIAKQFSAIIVFTKHPWDLTSEWVYPIYFFIIAFIIVDIFFLTLSFYKIPVKTIFMFIRSFIPVFPTYILLFPLSSHAGIVIHEYSRNNADIYDLVAMFADICFLLFIFFRDYYLRPIHAGTPLCNVFGWPSRFIPDDLLALSLFFDYVLLIFTLASQTLFAYYAFAFVHLFKGIKVIRELRRCPFVNYISSNAMVSLKITTMYVNICTIVILSVNKFETLYLEISAVVMFFILIIVTTAVRNRQITKIERAVMDENYQVMKEFDPQILFMVCKQKDILNSKTVDFLIGRSDGILKGILRMLRGDFSFEFVQELIDKSSFINGFILYKYIKIQKKEEMKLMEEVHIDSNNFWSRILEGDANELVHALFEKRNQVDLSFSWIKESGDHVRVNVKKLLKKGMPTKINIVGVFTFLFYVAFSSIVMVPIFRLNYGKTEFSFFPTILKTSLGIGSSWSNIMLVVENSVNCSRMIDFNHIVVSQILKFSFPEPYNMTVITVGDLYENFTTLYFGVRKNLQALTLLMRKFSDRKLSSKIRTVWYYPSVDFRSTKADLRMVMNYYLNEFITYFDTNMSVNRCNTSFSNHFRSDLINFVNTSLEMLDYYHKFIHLYKTFIANQEKSNNGYVCIWQWVLCIICFIVAVVLTLYWGKLNYERIYKIIAKYLRVTSHPFLQDYTYKSEVSKLEIYYQQINVVTGCISIAIILVAFTLVINEYSSDAFREMINLNLISVEIENLSLILALSVHTYFETYMFHNDPVYIQHYHDKIQVLYTSINEITKIFEPSKIKEFMNVDKLPSMLRPTNHLLKIEFLHDIYSQMNFIDLIEFFFFIYEQEKLRIPLDPNSEVFIHLLHLFITHAYASIESIHEEISHLAENRLHDIKLYVLFGFFVYTAYIVIHFCMIYAKYSNFKKMERIIHYHILKLPLDFICSQSCLMAYLIESEDYDKSKIKCMKELFDAANIPILFVKDKFAIALSSKPVSKVFDMKDEQIIGQSLLTLVPPENKRFYHNILSKIPGNVMVQGNTTNNEIVNFEARVTFFNDITMICLKEINELVDFEELITVHSQLYDDYLTSSFPFYLLNYIQDEEFKGYYQRNFRRYSFVTVAIENSINDLGSPIADMLNYFPHCFVFAHSCSLFMAIFVGENATFDAISCYTQFGCDESRRSGLIFEGKDLEIFFLGLPENIDSENYDEMPLHLSLEPIINLNMILDYTMKMIPGNLLVPNELSRYFKQESILNQNEEFFFVNNIDMNNLHFVSHTSSNTLC